MDFGPSAEDYAKHRKGFPRSFFERLPLSGTVLDLGTGTGTLARGYAERGVRAVGLDFSLQMLRAARDVERRVVARAEACPFRERSFTACIAGQCWHWFDGEAAARECARVLEPGGILAIAHFDYLVAAGNVAATTEALILQFNPGWPLAGVRSDADMWEPQLVDAGFTEIQSFAYDEDLEYTHEGWRGRIRACNGVIALPNDEARASFDRELKRLLAGRFPHPLVIPHRISCVWGRANR